MEENAKILMIWKSTLATTTLLASVDFQTKTADILMINFLKLQLFVFSI